LDYKEIFVASPIDNNTSLTANVSLNQDMKTGQTEQINAATSPSINIPNDDQNYHWFLSEIAGSRTTISLRINQLNGINAAMGVDGVSNHILSHIGA